MNNITIANAIETVNNLPRRVRDLSSVSHDPLGDLSKQNLDWLFDDDDDDDDELQTPLPQSSAPIEQPQVLQLSPISEFFPSVQLRGFASFTGSAVGQGQDAAFADTSRKRGAEGEESEGSHKKSKFSGDDDGLDGYVAGLERLLKENKSLKNENDNLLKCLHDLNEINDGLTDDNDKLTTTLEQLDIAIDDLYRSNASLIKTLKA